MTTRTNYTNFLMNSDMELKAMAEFIRHAETFGIKYEVVADPFKRNPYEVVVYWDRP